jgi:hypothetical protein
MVAPEAAQSNQEWWSRSQILKSALVFHLRPSGDALQMALAGTIAHVQVAATVVAVVLQNVKVLAMAAKTVFSGAIDNQKLQSDHEWRIYRCVFSLLNRAAKSCSIHRSIKVSLRQ